MKPPKGRLKSDDALVWRAVTETVTPLAGRMPDLGDIDPPAAQETKDQPKAKASFHHSPPPPVLARPLADLAVGRPKDVDKGTSRRLAKGALPIERRLDLHGMVQTAAQARLVRFIEESYDQGLRCVLVITGKGAGGRGVLKSEVPRWLNLDQIRPLIVAVTPAAPKDGGEGALYILIRRKRQ